MVCMSAVTWRMRQMRRRFVIRLHDIAKAFYRVKHDCIGRMADGQLTT